MFLNGTGKHCFGLLLVALTACESDIPTAKQERTLIQQTIADAMAALADHDEETWTMLTEQAGAWHLQKIDNDWQPTLTVTFAQEKFREAASFETDAYVHHWNERVQIDGPIASFWSPYVSSSDGEPTGCGVASYLLVKVDGSWIIASSVRSERTLLCQEYRDIIGKQ